MTTTVTAGWAWLFDCDVGVARLLNFRLNECRKRWTINKTAYHDYDNWQTRFFNINRLQYFQAYIYQNLLKISLLTLISDASWSFMPGLIVWFNETLRKSSNVFKLNHDSRKFFFLWEPGYFWRVIYVDPSIYFFFATHVK